MTFTPQTFNGLAAAERMLARGTAPYNSCLETVSTAIKGNVDSDSVGSYGDAIDGWRRCPTERRHSYGPGYTAPGGAVGYATSPSGAGHVWIHLGGDQVVSTDTPVNGRIGTTTVAAMRSRWGLGILGWTDWFLGHNIQLAGTAGGSTSPFPTTRKKDDSMRLYTVTDKDGTNGLQILDGQARIFTIGGPGSEVDDNEWAQIVASYANSGGSVITCQSRGQYNRIAEFWRARRIGDPAPVTTGGGGPVDLSPLLEALKKLPAEIAAEAIRQQKLPGN